MVLHRHILFSAETAADELVLNEAVVEVDTQHRRAFVERCVRALVGREQLHAAVFKRQRHAALRLKERMLRPRRRETLVDHIFALGNRACRVAAGDVLVRLYVVFVRLKHQRCVRLSGLRRAVDGGEDFILDLDELFRRFQRFHILCAYERDRVTEIVRDLADGDQRRLVFFDMPDVVLAGDVLRR